MVKYVTKHEKRSKPVFLDLFRSAVRQDDSGTYGACSKLRSVFFQGRGGARHKRTGVEPPFHERQVIVPHVPLQTSERRPGPAELLGALGTRITSKRVGRATAESSGYDGVGSIRHAGGIRRHPPRDQAHERL